LLFSLPHYWFSLRHSLLMLMLISSPADAVFDAFSPFTATPSFSH
jgi:hypothetical protein